MLQLETVLRAGLNDPEAGWNMGSFGAIAEFHHVTGDAVPMAEGLAQFTDRGGLRIERLEGVRPVAHETLSPRTHRWTQGVSLCLPEDEAAMNRRNTLTELGADNNALRCSLYTAPGPSKVMPSGAAMRPESRSSTHGCSAL